MKPGFRNVVLGAAGGCFMLGLVLAANPRHYGLFGSVVGAGLSVGMIVVAVRTYRIGRGGGIGMTGSHEKERA